MGVTSPAGRSPSSGVHELARVATWIFSIPASAAAPESVFSQFEWFQSKRRIENEFETIVNDDDC